MKNEKDSDSFKRQFTFGSGSQQGEKMSYSLKRNNNVSRPPPTKKNSLIENEYNTDQPEIILNEEKPQPSKVLRFMKKIRRNSFLFITVIYMLYVYYVYLFVSFIKSSIILSL